MQFAQANAHPKNCKRASTSPTQKEFQNIFSNASKKNKTRDTQTDTTMTLKRSADNGLHGRPRRTPAGNSGFKKLAVQWLLEHSTSHQHLWLLDSFVLRNRQLLKPAKRCEQCRLDSFDPNDLKN